MYRQSNPKRREPTQEEMAKTKTRGVAIITISGLENGGRVRCVKLAHVQFLLTTLTICLLQESPEIAVKEAWEHIKEFEEGINPTEPF